MKNQTTDHYYSKDSKSVFRPSEFEFPFEGRTLNFISGSGVFSIGEVDYCSLQLIENCDIKDGEHILDLGCGYGAVGICMLSKNPTITCDFSDVNKRAVSLTRKNLERNKISKERYKLYDGEGYEKLKNENEDGTFSNKLYDVILLNPPQSAGRKLCNQLILDAKEYLKVGGSIQVVARHNTGGSMFQKFLTENYGNCEPLSKRSGIRVYRSFKKE
jgi:16S rRNA G1207 methylase RsmC